MTKTAKQILTSLDKGEYLGKGGVDQALKELEALIRTEKLKLLAEIKGRRSTTFLAPTHGVPIADLEELESEL